MQPAQRIADVVTLLDGLVQSERERMAAVFNLPPLILSLHDQPRVPTAPAPGWRASMFTARLQSALGDRRSARVEARAGFAGAPASFPRGNLAAPHAALHGPGAA